MFAYLGGVGGFSWVRGGGAVFVHVVLERAVEGEVGLTVGGDETVFLEELSVEVLNFGREVGD